MERASWNRLVKKKAKEHEDDIYQKLDRAHLARATDDKRVVSFAWTMLCELDVFSHPFINHRASNAQFHLQCFPRPRENYFVPKKQKYRFDCPPSEVAQDATVQLAAFKQKLRSMDKAMRAHEKATSTALQRLVDEQTKSGFFR